MPRTARIADLAEALNRFEADLAPRLVAAYQGEWPAECIRVDVAPYTSWAGMYTTNDPPHVMISNSEQNAAWAGLEGIFHESSPEALASTRPATGPDTTRCSTPAGGRTCAARSNATKLFERIAVALRR